MKRLVLLLLMACGGPEGIELDPTDGPVFSETEQTVASAAEDPWVWQFPSSYSGTIDYIDDYGEAGAELLGATETTDNGAQCWGMLTDNFPAGSYVHSYEGCVRVKLTCPGGFCANGNVRAGIDYGTGIQWGSAVVGSQVAFTTICSGKKTVNQGEASFVASVCVQRTTGTGVKNFVAYAYGYGEHSSAPSVSATHSVVGGGARGHGGVYLSEGDGRDITANISLGGGCVAGATYETQSNNGSGWVATGFMGCPHNVSLEFANVSAIPRIRVRYTLGGLTTQYGESATPTMPAAPSCSTSNSGGQTIVSCNNPTGCTSRLYARTDIDGDQWGDDQTDDSSFPGLLVRTYHARCNSPLGPFSASVDYP